MLKSLDELVLSVLKVTLHLHNSHGLAMSVECQMTDCQKLYSMGNLLLVKENRWTKLRYKDVIKRHIKNTNVDDDTWEEKATNRSVWRGLVRASISAVEERRLQDYAQSHARRHVAAQSALHCTRCGKACQPRAGMVAHQRASNFT